jgi:hypothetical protein
MAKCQDVYDLMAGIRDQRASTSLSPTDLNALQQAGLVSYVSAEQYASLAEEVKRLSSDYAALSEQGAARGRLAGDVETETRKAHSILFHLEGKEKQAVALAKEAQDRAALQQADQALAAHEQEYDALIAKKSRLDTLTPLGDAYIGLTSLGARELRDMRFRLYRLAGVDFSAYWGQRQELAGELNDMADRGAQYVLALSGPMSSVDRAHLWSVGIGLAKLRPDVAEGASIYLNAYGRIGEISHNAENRVLAAEILSCLPRGVEESMPSLLQLERDVRQAGVPTESSLGTASILLLGQRADGSFATPNFIQFLHLTPSYEAAALLAIVNKPDLGDKFRSLRAVFNGWGYQSSEDVELASSYLTVSDLPVDGVTTKLAILARGLGAYLRYPLVASSIIASIPELEANEALNLIEEAYETVGKRAMPASPAELICLAVRMVHGVRSEAIGNLDATATAPAVAVGTGYLGGPRFFFLPVIVAHGSYYSTYSALGGVHPGHVHVGGGGFSG